MFFQGIGKGRAAFDISFDVSDGFTEKLIFGLRRKNIETLNQGEASIDHSGKLSRKHDQIFIFNSSTLAEFSQQSLRKSLFLKIRDADIDLAKLLDGFFSGLGNDFTFFKRSKPSL